MKKLAYSVFAIVAFLLLAAPSGTVQAQTCTAEDFGAVVDETARALRELNADGAKRYNAKLQEFQEKNNLSQDEIRQKAVELQDDRVGEFNREIEQLVNQMDVLSSTPAEQIDCGKLEELKQVRDRLLTVMGQKSGYMLANVDDALKTAPQQNAEVQREGKGDRETADDALPETPAAETQRYEPPQYLPENQQTALAPGSDDAGSETPQTGLQAPLEDPGLPERRPESANAERSPQAEESGDDIAAYTGEPERLQPPDGWDTSATDLDLPPPGSEDETFSIEEIRDAGRGVFGSITSEFAAAINYAFGEFGRPNAYITGSEGGAAFLAGLRYGKGNLHVKNGDISTIYWQGPSLGYDVGAEGSSTLFLVYNMKDQERIYGRFTGVGGSAYVAGGFGLNVLGKSGMIMVPIRTGIGLRIGANLAYLKFTERQTWNPF